MLTQLTTLLAPVSQYWDNTAPVQVNIGTILPQPSTSQYHHVSPPPYLGFDLDREAAWYVEYLD